jgi:aspartate kinase
LEARVYERLGAAGVSCYLVSLGPTSTHFVAAQEAFERVHELLQELDLPHSAVERCAMVSAMAADMWDTPGLIARIAEALYDAGVPVLQIADSPSSVSCLVAGDDAKRAVAALHGKFELGR